MYTNSASWIIMYITFIFILGGYSNFTKSVVVPGYAFVYTQHTPTIMVTFISPG